MDLVDSLGSHWQYKPKYLIAAMEPVSRLRESFDQGKIGPKSIHVAVTSVVDLYSTNNLRGKVLTNKRSMQSKTGEYRRLVSYMMVWCK